MKYRIQDLIDIEQFQSLQDRLNSIYPFPLAIIDNEGVILTATAWQDVCTKFHRQNKECEVECIKSDQYILEHISEANPAVSYRCPHGLIDNAMPIIFGGEHLGNFFTGQFFMEEPDLEFFRAQAGKYGFDEDTYLQAVQKVPIWRAEQVNSYLLFIKEMINVIGSVGLNRLKEIESGIALKENEEKYKALFERESDAVFIYDPDTTNIIEANTATSKMYGYDKDELIGMSCLKFSADVKESASTIKYISKEGHIEVPYRLHKKKDGTVFPVEIKGQKIKFTGQSMTFAVSKDISIRVEIEEKLRENENKFRSLFENMDYGFALHEMVFNEDGTPIDYIFLNVNEAFEKQTGLPKVSIIGYPVTKVFPGIENDKFDWIGTYGKVVLTGQSILFESYSEKIKRWYSIVAYRSEEGQFAVLIHDISDQKRSDQEKQKLKEQLQQAQKMEAIGTLAGGIAHDFNNILGVIMGYADLTLEDPSNSKDVINNITRVMKASYRAKDMVNQILAFSRKDEQTMGSVNIGKVVKEVISFLRSSIPTTIEISSKTEKGLALVIGNATQINQILMNLCTNAAHAMKENGGLLNIELKNVVLETDEASLIHLEPGTYQQLIVSDTGTGINKDIIERIFEPYFTTKEAGEGTGMGLAVIYGIVKNHGGSINVYSEPGKGTAFNVYFPVLDGGMTDSISIQDKVSLTGNNERILFVDDEIQLADLGTRMLEKLEYRVEKITSSIEALEVFKANPDKFDMIITDMTMPNMTGVKLAAEIHKIRPDIPIILCTGFSNGINKSNHLEKGISALVMKPVVKSELSKVIREVLDKKK